MAATSRPSSVNAASESNCGTRASGPWRARSRARRGRAGWGGPGAGGAGKGGSRARGRRAGGGGAARGGRRGPARREAVNEEDRAARSRRPVEVGGDHPSGERDLALLSHDVRAGQPGRGSGGGG